MLVLVVVCCALVGDNLFIGVFVVCCVLLVVACSLFVVCVVVRCLLFVAC